MAQTLLLDTVTWDLVLNINGNIAVASEPYSLVQDGASAIQTFKGEVFYDTSLGIDYYGLVLGKSPSLPVLKALLTAAVLTVPDIENASVFISALTGRSLTGQVQTADTDTGQVVPINFTVVNPQQ